MDCFWIDFKVVYYVGDEGFLVYEVNVIDIIVIIYEENDIVRNIVDYI